MTVLCKRWSRRRWVAIGGIAIAFIAMSVAAAAVLLGFLARHLRDSRTRGGGYELLARSFEFRDDNGRWPVDAVECFGAEIPPFDAWGTPLALRIEGDGASAQLFVRSAGRDRAWDTTDDWVVTAIPTDAANKRGLREKP